MPAWDLDLRLPTAQWVKSQHKHASDEELKKHQETYNRTGCSKIEGTPGREMAEVYEHSKMSFTFGAAIS